MNVLKNCILIVSLLGLFLTMPVLLEAQQGTTKGVIVPAYFFPYDNNDPGTHNVGPYWSTLIDAADLYKDRLIVVANPANGPGSNAGWEKQKYAEAISKVRAKGGKVIGYVHTCYGLTHNSWQCNGRTLADIHQEIDNWKNWYGVDGIFLDEAPTNSNKVQWMKNLNNYIAARFDRKNTVNNFGTTPPTALCIENGVARPEINVLLEQTTAYFDQNVAAIPTVDYNACILLHTSNDQNVVGRRNQAHGKKIHWFYLTNDNGAINPWDTLPSFFTSHF